MAVRNVDRKGVGALKVTTTIKDKYLIIECKRHGRKTAPELTAEFNSS